MAATAPPDLADIFSAATAAWFADAFPQGPTRAQREGWPAIARGEHVLLCAPTGSGSPDAGTSSSRNMTGQALC